MIDLHLSAFAPRWRFLYVVRIDAYGIEKQHSGDAAILPRPCCSYQHMPAALGQIQNICLKKSVYR